MHCHCFLHSRRLFTAGLLGAGVSAGLATLPGTAQASIPECRRSRATKLVSADQVEQAAGQQYVQMLQKAQGDRALAPADHPQLQRLRFIANRIIPFTPACNSRAKEWNWEVNLIASRQVNAFCMPGGKIAFFFGILSELQLDDDEVAMIMGHEAAHALLEHARERIAKNSVTTGGLHILSAVLGFGQLGDLGAQALGGLASLTFSRSDETQADMLGLIMAAQAGYDPRKGVSLWQKMGGTGGSRPPEWLSTHPSGEQRIKGIQGKLAQVLPTFQSAAKPGRQFGPPPRLPPAQPREAQEQGAPQR